MATIGCVDCKSWCQAVCRKVMDSTAHGTTVVHLRRNKRAPSNYQVEAVCTAHRSNRRRSGYARANALTKDGSANSRFVTVTLTVLTVLVCADCLDVSRGFATFVLISSRVSQPAVGAHTLDPLSGTTSEAVTARSRELKNGRNIVCSNCIALVSCGG